MTALVLPAWSSYAPQCGGVRRLVVGFSGGVDSTVLLHLACQWSIQSGLPLLAIHVNHQLSPHALRWQLHCATVCEQWGVPFVSQTVQVIPSGQGVEAAARHARYAAFANIVEKGDLLLLGHHRDDQVETVLLRLLRGSGVLGLRGMEALSTHWGGYPILRPLLSVPKQALVFFARQRGWPWIEDDSNHSDAFDRNFLRRQIMPLLAQRWPSAASSILRSARHCEDVQGLLDDLALEDLLLRIDENGGLQLHSPELPSLSLARQRNLIRYWLRCQKVATPTEAQLDQILTALVPAALDAMPVVQWPDVEIRRFRHRLYALRPLFTPPPAEPMPFSLGVSSVCPVSSGGMLWWQHGETDAARIGLASEQMLASGELTLRFRQGGEHCKLVRRPHRPLKKILQESGLAPWWRERIPLLYVDEVLAVIPGVGVCEGFQAKDGESGLRFGWDPPCLPQAWRHRDVGRSSDDPAL